MKITEFKVGQRLLVHVFNTGVRHPEEITLREFSLGQNYAWIEYQNGNQTWIHVDKYVVIEALPPKEVKPAPLKVLVDQTGMLDPGIYEVTSVEESSGSNRVGIVVKPVKSEPVAKHSQEFLNGYHSAQKYLSSPVEERKYKNPYFGKTQRDAWASGWTRGFADYTAEQKLV